MDALERVLSRILSRITSLEETRRLHPDMHKAEEEARKIALDGLKEKMHGLNDVRNRFVDKEFFERVHNKLEDRVKVNEDSKLDRAWYDKAHTDLEARIVVLETAKNTAKGARGVVDYIWQALMLGLGWAAARVIK